MSLNALNIAVHYGRKPVLHGITVKAEAGEMTAIVGPNGSGKSTLLKAICGDVPYTGTLTLNGHPITKFAPWEIASIRGVLPQSSTIAFPFTAIEIVRIGLTAGREAQNADLAQKALNRVGLSEFGDRFYQDLSGGEQQRVQLARVLAQVWRPLVDGIPRWLMLDEPVSSLDIAHQLDVMDIAARYARDGGGVLTVMHDLNLTALYADQVIVLSEGRVLAAGPTDEVLTDVNLSAAYGCHLRVNTPPPAALTYVLPHVASRGRPPGLPG